MTERPKQSSWSEMAGRAAQQKKTRKEEQTVLDAREKQQRDEVWAQKEIHDAWRSTEGHALRDLIVDAHERAVIELVTATTHEHSVALRAEIRVYQELLGSAQDEGKLIDAARRMIGYRRT